MVDVSRDEFDALAARVTVLEGKPASSGSSGPTGASGPVTPGQLPVKATPIQGAVRVEWTPVSDRDVKSVKVGRDGTDARGGGPWSTTDPGTARSRVFDKLKPSTTYAFRVEVQYTDGLTSISTVSATTPAPDLATGAPAPVSGDRRVPLVGRSKLPFNSLVFRNSIAAGEQFGDWRGVPVDGVMYFTGRGSWNDFRWLLDGARDYLASGRIIVMTMPHAPTSEGDSMNQRGANDAYKSQQRDLGKYLADAGCNVPNFCIRTDWESNGNWYNWSANRPGGGDALKASIRNQVTNLRAGGLTRGVFDQCWNKGPSQSGVDFSTFPGADIIDVVGVDQYDMWGPSFNQGNWDNENRKTPSIGTVQQLAASQDVMWSVDECGNTHGDSNQGGDNPVYWELLKKSLDAGASNLAWHVTYDEAGAPSSLAHDFKQNPKSSDRYKALWRP